MRFLWARRKNKIFTISAVILLIVFVWYFSTKDENRTIYALDPAEFSEYPSLLNFLTQLKKGITQEKYSLIQSLFLSFQKQIRSPENASSEYDRLLLKILTACLHQQDSAVGRINVAAHEIFNDVASQSFSTDDFEYYKEILDESPAVQVRSAALDILGFLEERATPAVSDIIFIVKYDKDSFVKCSALEALESIRGIDTEELLGIIREYDKAVLSRVYGEYIMILKNGEMVAPKTDERIQITLDDIPEVNHKSEMLLNDIHLDAGVFYCLTSLLSTVASHEEILKLTKDPDRKIRAIAALAASYSLDINNEMTDAEMEEGVVNTIDIMFNILKNDSAPFVRACAAIAIRYFQYIYGYDIIMRNHRVAQRLTEILKREKHPAVRTACLEAGAFDIKNNLSIYLNIVKDKKESPFVRASAANAFKHLCDNRNEAIEKGAAESLLEIALNSSNPPFFRYYAFIGSIAVASEGTEKKIIKLLRKKALHKKLDSYSDGSMFDLMRSSEAAIFLKELFNDSTYRKERYWIISSLAENGSPDAVDTITQFLDVILNDNSRNMEISSLFRSKRAGNTLLDVIKKLEKTKPSLVQQLLEKLEYSRNEKLRKYIREFKISQKSL